MNADDLLRARPTSSAPALDRARAAALAELAAQPVAPPWWRGAMLASGLLLALTVVAAAGTALAGSWIPDPARRLATVALLLALQQLAAFAAVAPGSPWPRRLAVLGGGLAMAALVALRGDGAPSSLPPWTCTVSHLGVGILPAAAMLWALRSAAPSVERALAAGLAAGTAGALLGELACEQGWRHVALFHLPAWLAVAAATVVVSRRIRPRAYAP